jgi:hypothetical protein
MTQLMIPYKLLHAKNATALVELVVPKMTLMDAICALMDTLIQQTTHTVWDLVLNAMLLVMHVKDQLLTV